MITCFAALMAKRLAVAFSSFGVRACPEKESMPRSGKERALWSLDQISNYTGPYTRSLLGETTESATSWLLPVWKLDGEQRQVLLWCECLMKKENVKISQCCRFFWNLQIPVGTKCIHAALADISVLCQQNHSFQQPPHTRVTFFAPSHNTEHSQESSWGETKQIPPSLSPLWPKRFSVLQRSVKCSESPEEDRDKWARNSLKERVQTQKAKSRVEWYQGGWGRWH